MPVFPCRCYLLLVLLLAALAGCRDVGAGKLRDEVVKKQSPKNRNIRQPKPVERPKKEDLKEELDVIARAYERTRGGTLTIGREEEVAVRKVGLAIKASVEIGPTLVVWIVD